MSIKLTWLPNPEADIDKYEIWSSPDNNIYTLETTITHDIGDPAVYDATIGRFYWIDTTGLVTDYYKIKAFDTVGNPSSFTVPKQAGPPTPPICVLFGTVLDLDGEPQTEAQIQIKIKDTKQGKDGQFVTVYGVTSAEVEVFTDDAGFWEANIMQGATVRVIIPKINLDVELTVPAQASAEITTLI